MTNGEDLKKEGGAKPEKQERDLDELAKQKAAGQREAAAEAVLVREGEATDSEAVETDPTAIANKHIESVPPKDREISSPKQVEILLYALQGTKDGDHLTSTVDKLGNLPAGFQETLALMGGPEDRLKAVAIARDFAADPVKSAEKTNKVKNIALSDLPESVRTAILKIILVEGPSSAQQAFTELAGRIETSPEKMTVIIQTLRKDGNFVSKDADNIRRAALKQFIEGVYPEFMGRPDVALMQKIGDIPYEKRGDNETVKGIAAEAASAMGDYVFDKRFRGDLGGAANARELVGKIEDGSIDDVSSVVDMLSEVLRRFTMENAVKEK